MILSIISSGGWKPIKLSIGGGPLCHIFFANDLILFSEATVEQTNIILHILDCFCAASEQNISKKKSHAFFSKNCCRT